MLQTFFTQKQCTEQLFAVKGLEGLQEAVSIGQRPERTVLDIGNVEAQGAERIYQAYLLRHKVSLIDLRKPPHSSKETNTSEYRR